MQLAFCHVNPCTGSTERFPVFPVCKPGVIMIFVCDRAAADLFATAIADVRGFIKPDAAFPFKIGAGLAAGGAGSAFDAAE